LTTNPPKGKKQALNIIIAFLLPLADFDWYFSLNVRAPYFLTQIFLGHLHLKMPHELAGGG
jgi:hypothetical protein